MDKIEKLLRKISKKDREELLRIIKQLILGDRGGLGMKKVKGTDFYRVRKGRFRIIFHKDKSGEVVIDSVKLRNEKTYKDL